MTTDHELREAAPALLVLARQYENDLRYPPRHDSIDRRIAAIRAVLDKIDAREPVAEGEVRNYPGHRTKAEWDVIAQASYDRSSHLPDD